MKWLLILLLLAPGCAFCAEEINMDAIIQIESSGNALAYNKKEGAVGLCQVRKPVLTEFNNKFHRNYDMKDLLVDQVNVMVADWYMNTRIPALLNHYHIKDTVENRLWAYNAGVGNVIKKRMPETTKSYIVKYERITNEKM
jgi:soluble lytic murein transglycosylase-like protein